MFKKLLVANRGTIAIRIIRACRELGISTVAVYSTADKNALHVRMADESVCIGPPAAEDSYLNIPAILSAATTFGADAVHPGYGFLSENGDFAEACQKSGLELRRSARASYQADGRQAARAPNHEARGRPRAAGQRGHRRHRVARGAGRRETARLPGADQGGCGRRRQGDASRSRRQRADAAVSAGAGRIRGVVQLAQDVPREISRACASRRVSDSCRFAAQRDSSRRARLLDSAAPSEGDRGVAVPDSDPASAREDGQGCGARGRSGRLFERRHGGISARRQRRVLFYRDEHPDPGRARRDRDGHGR